jgi:hypothetical protein
MSFARLFEHMDDVMLSQFELEGAAGEDRVLIPSRGPWAAGGCSPWRAVECERRP